MVLVKTFNSLFLNSSEVVRAEPSSETKTCLIFVASSQLVRYHVLKLIQLFFGVLANGSLKVGGAQG